MSMWSIMLLAAAVLAILISALFIGVCLLIAWTSDAIRGHSQQEQQGMHDGDSARWMAHGAADGRHQGAPGVPVAPRRVGR